MIENISNWHTKLYDDGQEVLLRTVQVDNLQQAFNCAYRVAEIMIGTDAEKDFSVSADPTSVFVVLHAYNKGRLPVAYQQLAERIDQIISEVQTANSL